jgi:hypothetical protein
MEDDCFEKKAVNLLMVSMVNIGYQLYTAVFVIYFKE